MATTQARRPQPRPPAKRATAAAPLPANERARLEALWRYQVLDTAPEEAFDRITRIAARLFQAPVALISLIDAERQWFKSCVGIKISQTGREVSICAHTILSEDVVVINDLSCDHRFASNPLVRGQGSPLFYAGAPLRTHDGYVLGTLCVLDTVPRAPLNKDQLPALRDLAAVAVEALEHRLTTLARLDSERALRESQERMTAAASEANWARTEFVTRMSNEVRTPLNSILNLTRLMEDQLPQRGEDRDRLAPHVASIRSSGGHLLGIINDARELARVESRQVPLSPERIDLDALIAGVTASMEPLVRAREITLQLPPSGGNLVSDQRSVRQVLLNLVANAVRFSPKGGTVTVSSRQAPDGVELRVADQGPGIAPEEQELIFQEFERLPSTTAAEGSGLGLSLSRALVELLGGRIWVESSLGLGSTFVVALPSQPVEAMGAASG